MSGTELVSQLHGATITGTMSCLSPNGLYVAHTSGSKLVVRKANSPGEVINVYQSLDKIEKIDFSPDSAYILCALFTRNAVQVFSVKDIEWKCRINEGVAGVISASWSPDSRSVITESDFGIYLSVWSLCDNTQSVISLPKPSIKGFRSQLHSFSDCKRYLAVIHRIELQDQIGVYFVNPLLELVKFKARSNDVVAVHWVPKDTHIITMDSPLNYKCCIYNPSGEVRVSFYYALCLY
jgi:WD40 repeat protein